MYKIGDKVKVNTGIYTGKEGIVEAIGNAPKKIGVGSAITGVVGMLTWFREDEIEKIN